MEKALVQKRRLSLTTNPRSGLVPMGLRKCYGGSVLVMCPHNGERSENDRIRSIQFPLTTHLPFDTHWGDCASNFLGVVLGSRMTRSAKPDRGVRATQAVRRQGLERLSRGVLGSQ